MDFNEQLTLVREEEKKTVKRFLKKKHSFCIETTGMTLLHLAAKYGTKKLVKSLLKSGFNVNTQDSLGRTPIIMALRREHIPIMDTLATAGANLFLHNYKKQCLLHEVFAVDSLNGDFYNICFWEWNKKFSSSEEMAQMMLEAGCQLYQAAYLKDVKIIEYLLDQGLQINSVHPLEKVAALHVAVAVEDVKSVKLLIKYGSCLEALDIDGMNPLAYMYKSYSKHTTEKIEILQCLLDAGVSPMSYAPDKVFHIQSILMRGNLEIIRVILQSKINFSTRDGKKRILLHYLAINTNPGIVEELKLLDVADLGINEIDRLGTMPLHVAVMHQNVEMVRFLLEQGALINVAEYDLSYTPLMYSGFSSSRPNFEQTSIQIVELLLHQGADPQVIALWDDGSKMTIFNIDKPHCFTNRQINCVIAQLALVEELGTSINEIICDKIKSNHVYDRYFNRCKWILQQNIHESVTLFKLITANKTELAKYLRDKQLVLKLKRISYKQELKSCFLYYWHIIKMNFSKEMEYRMLKKEATDIINGIFESTPIKNDLIVAKIVQQFKHEELRKLCMLEKDSVNF